MRSCGEKGIVGALCCAGFEGLVGLVAVDDLVVEGLKPGFAPGGLAPDGFAPEGFAPFRGPASTLRFLFLAIVEGCCGRRCRCSKCRDFVLEILSVLGLVGDRNAGRALSSPAWSPISVQVVCRWSDCLETSLSGMRK